MADSRKVEQTVQQLVAKHGQVILLLFMLFKVLPCPLWVRDAYSLSTRWVLRHWSQLPASSSPRCCGALA